MSQREERHMNGPDANRTRHVVIGAGLLALVIVILGVAWILNDRLRPEVGVTSSAENTSPVAEVASPTVAVTEPDAAASPTPETAVDESPTAELTVEQEVEQAYLRYWEVYSEALYQLDTSRAHEVAAGEELRRIEEEVAGFRDRGRAVRVDVSHTYFIYDVTDDEAKIYDEILNRSYTVDPETKEPSQGPDIADLQKDIFFLEKIDGVWKVTRSVRQEES
jgi:hypothetical protein